MERLTREQWLDHGLNNLAASGFTSLKADLLAKSLGVSRGSFYWHFKDLAAFHEAVLARWRDLAVNTTIRQLEAKTMTPEQKIKQLVEMAGNSLGHPSLERAIRAWAFNNSGVKTAVDEVDQQCLVYIQGLLTSIGFTEQIAFARAHITYSGYLGQIMLDAPIGEVEQAIIIDELIKMAIRPLVDSP